MMPEDTFLWKGIDGTEIFTHFMTAQEMHADGRIENFTTYVPRGNASYVMGEWRRTLNKEVVNEALLTYGWGDGGGSTVCDVEMLKRMQRGIPDCSTTELSTTAEFLSEMKEQSQGKLDKWGANCDQKEIDLLYVESDKIYPIEIKKNSNPTKATKNFRVLEKYKKEIKTGIIFDTCERIRPINELAYSVPVDLI